MRVDRDDAHHSTRAQYLGRHESYVLRQRDQQKEKEAKRYADTGVLDWVNAALAADFHHEIKAKSNRQEEQAILDGALNLSVGRYWLMKVDPECGLLELSHDFLR